MSKFDALGVNIETSVKMPIIYPGEVDPVLVVGADGVPTKEEGYIEFLPWDSAASRDLDRSRFVDGVRKGFRQKSRAELRAEAEKENPIEQQVDRLVALAVGWRLVSKEGTVIDMPFSKENAREMFSAPAMGWLMRQSFAFVANEANFMTSSSKTS